MPKSGYLLLLILTTILMYLLPYRYGVEDQAIYIPLIKKEINPQLFYEDYLIQNNHQKTPFIYLVKFLVKITGKDIKLIFTILYFLSLYFFFLGVYFLTYTLFDSQTVSTVSIALFLFPKWVGATGLQTYEIYLHPRFLITPLILFCLYFLIRKKYLLLLFALTIILLIHPISVIALTIITLIYLIYSYNNKLLSMLHKLISYILIVPIVGVIIFAFLLSINKAINLNNLIMNKEWLTVVQKRDSYAFPQLWNIQSFASLLIFYLFYLLFTLLNKITKQLPNIKKESTALINISILTTLLLALITIIINQFIPFSLLIQLQLARSLTIFSYMALICFAYVITRVYKLRVNPFYKLIIMSLFIFTVLWNNQPNYPNDSEWIDIQLWAKNNTSINEVFLTPPNKTGFRIFSERKIIGEYKDGAPVIFSFKFATIWRQRMEDLQSYILFSENDINRLKTKYHFDYVVVEKPKSFDFIKVHENNKYTIYKPTYY